MTHSFPTRRSSERSLAETYMALGRLPAAEREYQAALEVAPDNAWTLNNLAWLRMSLGKAEEAVRPARKAAEIAPGAPEIADTLGMILPEVGDKREALDLLRKARQGAADNPALPFHFAQALAANGETDRPVVELRALQAPGTAIQQRLPAETVLRARPARRQKSPPARRRSPTPSACSCSGSATSARRSICCERHARARRTIRPSISTSRRPWRPTARPTAPSSSCARCWTRRRRSTSVRRPKRCWPS